MPAPPDPADPAVRAARERLRSLSPAQRSALVRLAAARSGAGPAAEVETLRPGDGPPLVLVHPVGGELFCYSALVAALGGTFPVLGLDAGALLRGPSRPTVQDVARSYATRLDGTGAATVAGWSFGAVLAFEIARLVTPDRTVVAIDSLPAGAGSSVGLRSTDVELRVGFAEELARSAPLADDVVRLAWDADDAAFVAAAAAALDTSGLGPDESDLAARLTIHRNAAAALERHRSSPGGPAVRVVWALDTATELLEPWRRVSGGEVDGCGIVADHWSLLRAPAVHDVARVLQEVHQQNTKGSPA
ncbi:thioesterase domain-containing protein [Jatrophihabitans endophyticus]|nr:thioesterase domain-containing protein [Jatrophihabitans endophyticus]